MKKRWLALAVLIMALSLSTAAAEMAEELTSKCRISVSSGKHVARLTDGKATTIFETRKESAPYIEITLPDGTVCGGLYMIWPEIPAPYVIMAPDGNGWTVVQEGSSNGFVHDFLPLNGLERFRICPVQGGLAFRLSDIRLFSKGELPGDVQVWSLPPEKAELLVLVAHPDDEYIFMGGTIPYYSGELKKDVVVAYMTYGTAKRRTELLNGLWTAGHRTYPVIGTFKDEYTSTLKKAYALWGEENALAFVHGLLDTYQPDIVVTHDLKGEYGHGAHRLCADAAVRLIASGETQVQKLYIHLYGENRIKMDWDQKLNAFEGRTALEVARAAWKRHASQQGGRAKYRGKEFKFDVVKNGMFDNSVFGLYHSAVGEDTQKNDFFEHVQR